VSVATLPSQYDFILERDFIASSWTRCPTAYDCRYRTEPVASDVLETAAVEPPPSVVSEAVVATTILRKSIPSAGRPKPTSRSPTELSCPTSLYDNRKTRTPVTPLQRSPSAQTIKKPHQPTVCTITALRRITPVAWIIPYRASRQTLVVALAPRH
jgi:hypothetical protein